ncbi:MAG TPA: DUF6174 domain-containing protein, partial [Gemmatimonadales bacterium]|nr:DUF6174 domain-containing protein [Gemmatimonadales bacterium]
RLALAATVAACTGAVTVTGLTSLTLGEIQASRAAWAAQAPAHYSYVYEVTGFFNALDGRAILLEVRQDTVRSATLVATGQPVPGSAAPFPTITGLFDLVAATLENGRLAAVVFDPRLRYPRRIDIVGPADASGSVFASALQPLP